VKHNSLWLIVRLSLPLEEDKEGWPLSWCLVSEGCHVDYAVTSTLSLSEYLKDKVSTTLLRQQSHCLSISRTKCRLRCYVNTLTVWVSQGQSVDYTVTSTLSLSEYLKDKRRMYHLIKFIYNYCLTYSPWYSLFTTTVLSTVHGTEFIRKYRTDQICTDCAFCWLVYWM
jgi:hypothetical protein